MKQFVLGVPSEDDVPESDSLGTPLSDGGAADSEAHSELVLRAPLFGEYSLSVLLTITLVDRGISSQKVSILLQSNPLSPTSI